MAWARNLRCHNDGVAVFTLHPAANNILCPADPFDVGRHRIAFGSVEKVDAGVQAAVEYTVRLCFIGLRPECHRPHADI